mmetsp:Transcript_5036/g.7612  ORF Transcript_5036/g.7612 Transcript_5036/m.7612 type:complete len:291 (+) Transcript_5036:1538-2410(+)
MKSLISKKLLLNSPIAVHRCYWHPRLAMMHHFVLMIWHEKPTKHAQVLRQLQWDHQKVSNWPNKRSQEHQNRVRGSCSRISIWHQHGSPIWRKNYTHSTLIRTFGCSLLPKFTQNFLPIYCVMHKSLHFHHHLDSRPIWCQHFLLSTQHRWSENQPNFAVFILCWHFSMVWYKNVCVMHHLDGPRCLNLVHLIFVVHLRRLISGSIQRPKEEIIYHQSEFLGLVYVRYSAKLCTVDVLIMILTKDCLTHFSNNTFPRKFMHHNFHLPYQAHKKLHWWHLKATRNISTCNG